MILNYYLLTNVGLTKDVKKTNQISKTIHRLSRKEEAHPKAGRGWVLLLVFTHYELWPS